MYQKRKYDAVILDQEEMEYLVGWVFAYDTTDAKIRLIEKYPFPKYVIRSVSLNV